MWEIKEDFTLDAPDSTEGLEVASPIFRDTKDDVEDLYVMCTVLNKCGNAIWQSCGGHIHIGNDYIEELPVEQRIQAYQNMYEIYGNAEKIILLISNEEGNLPRPGIVENAAAISGELEESLRKGTINIENESDAVKFLTEIQETHEEARYRTINTQNITEEGGLNTIEFRGPNGSLKPNVIEANKLLCGRIVQMSRELTEYDPSNEFGMKKVELKEKLKEDIPEEEKLEVLLELLFRDEERDIYRKRYYANAKLLESCPPKKNPFKNLKFGKVDFTSKRYRLCDISQSIRGRRASRNAIGTQRRDDADDREHA